MGIDSPAAKYKVKLIIIFLLLRMDAFIDEVSPLFWNPMDESKLDLCKKYFNLAQHQDKNIKMLLGYLIVNEIARRLLHRLFRHFRIMRIIWIKQPISASPKNPASYIFLRIIAHNNSVKYPYQQVILSTTISKHLNPGDIDNEYKRSNEYLISMFFNAAETGGFVYAK